MIFDPFQITAGRVARMQNRRMTVGNACQLIEPCATQPSEFASRPDPELAPGGSGISVIPFADVHTNGTPLPWFCIVAPTT